MIDRSLFLCRIGMMFAGKLDVSALARGDRGAGISPDRIVGFPPGDIARR
ncbi:hypothetical protein [Nocardia miyunensis]|nr:hypothetical protein [Nocardia miyunensis]